MTHPTLSIQNLTVEIPTRRGILRPADVVSYDIAQGEILGLVGAVQSGNTVAAMQNLLMQ